MQHLECAVDPSWLELESVASRAALQLSARQIAFSNEQPPPELFDHLIPSYEICDALHSSVSAEGDVEGKAPLLHLLQTHPLVLNVYNSSIAARLMREGAGVHLHCMPRVLHWTLLRAAQNEAWCRALLVDGDKFASDKNFEHAHRCYDQALQMNPESVAALLCKARALFAASTFDDAIQCITRAQKIDYSNSEAERLMQQVKIRIQELTGARASSGSKAHHGADNAVDKARAKLGIHNKTAEQDLAAFDAELLVREDAARSSSRHKDRHKERCDSREDQRHRRKDYDKSDGERHRHGERDSSKRERDRDRDRDKGRERGSDRDGDKDAEQRRHKHKHRHRRRHRSRSSSRSSSSGSR